VIEITKVMAMLAAILAALSRRDVLCFGYIFFAVLLGLRIDWFEGNREKRRKLWDWLQYYNYFVCFIHLAWVLPAVLLPWNDDAWVGRSSALEVAAAFGVRFGLGIKLRDDDPRISILEPRGNGFVYDLLLFVMLCIQERSNRSEIMELCVSRFRAVSENAAALSDRLASLRAELKQSRVEELDLKTKRTRDAVAEASSCVSIDEAHNPAVIKLFAGNPFLSIAGLIIEDDACSSVAADQPVSHPRGHVTPSRLLYQVSISESHQAIKSTRNFHWLSSGLCWGSFARKPD